MKVTPTAIPEVLIIEPKVFGDERGFFFESFNQQRFEQATGVHCNFVLNSHSRSARNVLRGLHYQIKQPQGKLVRVAAGEIFDVVVDIRKSSPTFGRWVGTLLSDDNKRQLWAPPGFAHGFQVVSECADVLYMATEYYAPEHERSIIWNDSALAITWPLNAKPVLSRKDQAGAALGDAEVFP